MKKGLSLCLVLIFVAFSPMITTGSGDAPLGTSDFTEFSWTGSADNVELIGEWDWNNPHTMNESNGVWKTQISLAEGHYCYKFIIDGNYIFDPENQYRGYCGDYENSIVRVKDYSRPSFSSSIVGDMLTVSFIPGSSGAGPDGVPSAIAGATWDSINWQWQYDLSGLEDGKHTLHLEINDLDGNLAYDELLPFWRGEQSNFSWDDALIYMIMTDRFVNGNTSNDPIQTGASQGADWMGGDFAGITEKISSGYFSDLGVNVLWLTPFNTGANDTGKASDGQHDVSAYHGYWPVEPRQVEPRLGSEAELHELVQTAHNSGIRVMMDYVINHVHENHSYYLNNQDWFNQGCICGTSECGWTEHRLDCQFASYLPDVNWKNREASEQMITDLLWWLEEFDLDGVRVDAVKHVDDLAITNLATRVNERFETSGTDYYLKGETAMGWDGHSLEDNQDQYGTINQYMGEDGLDGQADFVLYHAVVDNVFTSNNMDYSHLDYWTNRSQDQYTPGSTMVTFVGSHDVPRFTSRADPGTSDEWNQWVEDGLPGQPGTENPYISSLQAHGWLLTTPGAAMIYMGDEFGEYGGADPDNRHMWRGNNSWNQYEESLAENISSLGVLRQQSEALRRGTYSTILAQTDILVYSMTTSDESMNIILNRGDTNWTWNDYSMNDSVVFGEYSFEENIFSVPNNSVTVIKVGGNLGCTNSTAINYDSIATVDDNSCQYPLVEGCMNLNATNYDPDAEVDNGSCIFPEPEPEPEPETVDTDGDGVADGDDLCPNTIEGVVVNIHGCSSDDDGDGIPNTQDECPSHFGYLEHLGCAECLPSSESVPCPCGSSVGWEGMCTCVCNDEGMFEGHMDNGTFGIPWVENENESSNDEDNNSSAIETDQAGSVISVGIAMVIFIPILFLSIIMVALFLFMMRRS